MDTEQHGHSEWPCDCSGYFVRPHRTSWKRYHNCEQSQRVNVYKFGLRLDLNDDVVYENIYCLFDLL